MSEKEIFQKIFQKIDETSVSLTRLESGATNLINSRNEAIERAEKAEREVERLSKIITECDGVECVKHDGLVRMAVKERKEAEERAAKAKKIAQEVVSILADAHDEETGCAFTLDIDAEDSDVRCLACLAQIQLAEITGGKHES